ncbi:MAG: tRNA lysidine(34) synthetase TilS [Lachnoclostridium edouardi]|uniref:tRNA lysidine(34) synthetase TilS n=1 Tax=Lachnoclostridium edouardi TaxID=1926283 RepID=UPI0026DC52B8|nr:tRNA lysidine(34) synthetase TilS [Lachnoclostridium edouardi]MDO4277912.1 tRNA lysidine(34) synthetase TilS [Lachnoclostridium edouardi]
MYHKILNTIRKYKMAEQGDHIIIALSGGADSVCLLHVLKTLSPVLGITLEALHVHHGLRGEEANRDAGYCSRLGEQLGVSVKIVNKDVKQFAKDQKLSLEEAGRILRYQALREAAEEAGKTCLGVKIAVAHHIGDRAETILHNLFRGSGIKGIGGIQPVNGKIIRPLLETDREEILFYLRKNHIDWCQDSTNEENHYTRNKIRNQLIPYVEKEINPMAVKHIEQTGKILSMADSYLEKQGELCFKAWGTVGDGFVGYPAKQLSQEEEILQFYIIRKMIGMLSGTAKDIGFSHIEAVRQLADKQVGKKTDLPYGLEGIKEYDQVKIKKKADNRQETVIEKDLEKFVEIQVFPWEKHKEIPKNQYTKWFDYDKIENALCLRFRRTGDYITLKDGGRKTLKKFMIESKIPRPDRDRIPVLADGNHIVWIVGYRISEYYKITEHTKKVIQVIFNGGENNG